MNFRKFANNHLELLQILSSRLVLNPTEKELYDCAIKIGHAIINDYPNLKNNLDTVIDYSWNIVEIYVLPMTEDMCDHLLSMVKNNPKLTQTINNNFCNKKVEEHELINNDSSIKNMSGDDIYGLIFGIILSVMGVYGFFVSMSSNNGVGFFISLVFAGIGFGGLYGFYDKYFNKK